MIWFILPLAIGLVLVIRSVDEERKSSYGQPWMAAICGTGMTVVATLVVVMLGNLLCSGLDNGTEETNRYELLALKDTSVNTGSFFLGSGSIDEQPAFYYYQQGARGATLESVKADKALIIEEDIDEPYLSIVTDTSSNHWFYLGGLDEYYEFHIPAGSIVTSYKLDAE